MQCLLAATVLCLAIPVSWQGGGWSLQVRDTAGHVDLCIQRHDEGLDHCLSRLPYWLDGARMPFPVIRLRAPTAGSSRLEQHRDRGQPALQTRPLSGPTARTG